MRHISEENKCRKCIRNFIKREKRRKNRIIKDKKKWERNKK